MFTVLFGSCVDLLLDFRAFPDFGVELALQPGYFFLKLSLQCLRAFDVCVNSL